MNIYYTANARMPTEKAHGLQISKMCEAYAKNGHKVELIIPDKKNNISENLFDFYGVKNIFGVTYIPVPRFFPVSSILGYYLIEIIFLFRTFFLLRKEKESFSVITRDILFVLFFGKSFHFFYEMHDFPEQHLWFWKIAIKRAKGIIVTNAWKKAEVMKQFSLTEDKLLIAPNGFDPQVFSPQVEQVERGDLGISSNAVVICYAGMLKTLGVGKGVDFLIEAMSSLPSNVVYLFVGGSEVDIQEYKIIAKQNKVQDRVFFVGRVPYNELAKYLKVADAFVAPFPDTEHYRHYMSPIKLFEYMAVGKPVIASDLPSIKEVLGKYGFYFTPENMNEFIAAVNTVCDENDLNQEYTEDLLGHSRQYTWDKRAKNIIEFIAVVLRT